MKHDLEKTTINGTLPSVKFEFYYSSFTDYVTIKSVWPNIDEVEKVAIPAEKIDELIAFLQEAKFMYELGLPTQDLFPGTMDELNQLGGSK